MIWKIGIKQLNKGWKRSRKEESWTVKLNSSLLVVQATGGFKTLRWRRLAPRGRTALRVTAIRAARPWRKNRRQRRSTGSGSPEINPHLSRSFNPGAPNPGAVDWHRSMVCEEPIPAAAGERWASKAPSVTAAAPSASVTASAPPQSSRR